MRLFFKRVGWKHSLDVDGLCLWTIWISWPGHVQQTAQSAQLVSLESGSEEALLALIAYYCNLFGRGQMCMRLTMSRWSWLRTAV